MSNQLCLLCLQAMDKDESEAKSIQKIRVETLCKLLTECHPNYKPFHHQSELGGDEICEICDDCYPLVSTIDEIKKQITLLEQEIGSKVKQIHTTILDASSGLLNNGDHGRDKTIRIRKMILRATGENAEHQDETFVTDEVEVKMEHEVEDVDPLADVENQVFDDQYNSYSLPSVEKPKEEETDDLFDDEDDVDTAFCIIPSSQKKLRGRPKSTNKKPPLRKRKREDSSAARILSKTKATSKRIKFESSRPPSLQATRSSIRAKQQPAPLKGVKTLVVSLKKISYAIKKSTARSDSASSSDDDNKSDPADDKDWTPKNKDDYIGTSADEVEDTKDTILSHKCTYCAKKYFTTESTLNYHVARFHSVACTAPLCTARFRTNKARDAHLKHAHEDLALHQCQLQCRICGKKFLRQGTLAAHMVIRHEKGEKKFSCVKCSKSFCLEENYERHLKLHDVEAIKPLVCAVCDDRFANEARLQRHLATQTHDTRSFKCNICLKGCNSRVALERHLRSHTKEKPEKCPHCDATWADKITLQRHILRSHAAGPAPHICHICGKGFYIAFDLKIHLDRHDGKHLVKCDTCGDTLVDQKTLKSHRIKMHGEDPIVCDECGRRYTTMGALKSHKKIHEGDKKHKCQTCGASFLRPWELTSHMRSHSGERPHPCPHCEKAFKTKIKLSNHVNGIHTPGYVVPTPHRCPHCSKGFQYPYVLEGHIRAVHTGERPFTCNQCGKGFAVKSLLTLHLKGTHGVILDTKERLPRSKKDAFHEEEQANA